MDTVKQCWAGQKYFVQISKLLLADLELTPTDKLMAFALASLDLDGKGFAFPSLERLGIMLDRGVSAIKDSTRRLQDVGWIRKIQNKRTNTTIYHMTFPVIHSTEEFEKRFSQGWLLGVGAFAGLNEEEEEEFISFFNKKSEEQKRRSADETNDVGQIFGSPSPTNRLHKDNNLKTITKQTITTVSKDTVRDFEKPKSRGRLESISHGELNGVPRFQRRGIPIPRRRDEENPKERMKQDLKNKMESSSTKKVKEVANHPEVMRLINYWNSLEGLSHMRVPQEGSEPSKSFIEVNKMIYKLLHGTYKGWGKFDVNEIKGSMDCFHDSATSSKYLPINKERIRKITLKSYFDNPFCSFEEGKSNFLHFIKNNPVPVASKVAPIKLLHEADESMVKRFVEVAQEFDWSKDEYTPFEMNDMRRGVNCLAKVWDVVNPYPGRKDEWNWKEWCRNLFKSWQEFYEESENAEKPTFAWVKRWGNYKVIFVNYLIAHGFMDDPVSWNGKEIDWA